MKQTDISNFMSATGNTIRRTSIDGAISKEETTYIPTTSPRDYYVLNDLYSIIAANDLDQNLAL